MISFLNFLYKGMAFMDPRFGAKNLFWVLVFSLGITLLDIVIACFSYFFSLSYDGFLLYMVLAILIRFIPLFVIRPFNNKRFSVLYVYDRQKKYWLNSIIAFLLFVLFLVPYVWVMVIMTQ